jgi:phosphoribosylpyrophosphate synthetase
MAEGKIIMFNIKQHNSGEVEVTLTERLRQNYATITWNYFEQKDVMIPLLQAAAIRHTYGNDIDIVLDAPYLPYARQDRVFEAGQPIAFNEFIKVIKTQFNRIRTMALHCSSGHQWRSYSNIEKLLQLENMKYNAMALQSDYNIVFPDESARNHYYYPDAKMYTFIKYRDDNGAPHLTLDRGKLPEEINHAKPFLICDDIGDGNRTFVACVEALKNDIMNSDTIKIELMLYHAFCSYGLQNIIDAGISKLKIINPDSYHFLINKFPDHKDFVELVTFKGQ